LYRLCWLEGHRRASVIWFSPTLCDL